MADTPASRAAQPPLRSRLQVSQYFAALKLPLVLVCILAVALGAYYVFYVSQQTSDVVTRNFRLLAKIGEHIEAAIRSDRTVLSNMRFADESLEAMKDHASKFFSFIQFAKIVKWPTQTGSQPTEGVMALKFVERNTQIAWVLRDQVQEEADSPWQVRLYLDNLIEPILREHVEDRTFDALMVAAPDGRVIFRTADKPLRVVHLAKLVVSKDAKGIEVGKFENLAQAAGMMDVVIAGDDYKLFTQPCCGLVSTEGAEPSTGWVVVGITSQRQMGSESYAVSISSFSVIFIGLLLAFLSWPFLKLLLIGQVQRIKRHDVVLVGTSALFGIALFTICALDLYAYKTLEGTLDDQLEMFANEIAARANEEIKAASVELDRLATAVERQEFPGPKFPAPRSVSDLAGPNPAAPKVGGTQQPLLSDTELSAYPDFKSFALIDENGQQTQKMTLGSFVMPRIPVDDREYFIHWTTEGAGTTFFESIQSATTGAREAVVSTRRRPGLVAALSIPMRTLIDPVIVPGFGFVAIRRDGEVIFHSDRQFSLSENFFDEIDNSQRLRGPIFAGRQDWGSFRHWGQDYRAFVFPMQIAAQPFTLITFYDQNNVRAGNIDSLVLTAIFLLLYTGLCVGACIAILITVPRYWASWLWPDPA
jgi:hypothetical protein